MQSNCVLTEVNLSRNELGDEGLQALCAGWRGNASSSVRELNLTDNGITASGLAHLAALVDPDVDPSSTTAVSEAGAGAAASPLGCLTRLTLTSNSFAGSADAAGALLARLIRCW